MRFIAAFVPGARREVQGLPDIPYLGMFRRDKVSSRFITHTAGNMARKTRAASTWTASTGPLNLAMSRQRNGITLEQIADSTKISIRFLRAIENEEFDKLPGGIFSTSYLRQYAAASGFDEQELLAHYERRMAPPASNSTEVKRERSFLDRWFRVPAHASRP